METNGRVVGWSHACVMLYPNGYVVFVCVLSGLDLWLYLMLQCYAARKPLYKRYPAITCQK